MRKIFQCWFAVTLLQRIFQCLLAIIFIWIVLFVLEKFTGRTLLWAVGAGSLASSAYIVFVRPHSEAASGKQIIISYLVCSIIGLLGRLVITTLVSDLHFHSIYMFGTAAAIALGLSIFVMSLLKLRHPPATGIALVAVLEISDYSVFIVIILSAIFLSLIELIFNRWLKRLA